jgi:hypothetical protein
MAEYYDEASGMWLDESAYDHLLESRKRKKEEAAQAEHDSLGRVAGRNFEAMTGVPAQVPEAVVGAGTFALSMLEQGIDTALSLPQIAARVDARAKEGSAAGKQDLPEGAIAGDRALPGGVPFKPEILERLNEMRAKGIDVDHLVRSGQFSELLKEPPKKWEGAPDLEVVEPPEGTFKDPEAPTVIDGATSAYMRNPRLAALERARDSQEEIHQNIQGMLNRTYFTSEEEGRMAKNVGAALPIVLGAVANPTTVLPALGGAMFGHEVGARIGRAAANALGEDPEYLAEKFGTAVSFGPGMVGGHKLGAMLERRYHPTARMHGAVRGAMERRGARRMDATHESALAENLARDEPTISEERMAELRSNAENAARKARLGMFPKAAARGAGAFLGGVTGSTVGGVVPLPGAPAVGGYVGRCASPRSPRCRWIRWRSVRVPQGARAS